MKINSKITNSNGQEFNVDYYENENPDHNMEGKILGGVHAYCFFNDKMVLVNHPKSGWVPPGGGNEDGETWAESTIREVKEETNMKVLHQELIGFQDIYLPDKTIRQTRSMCIVEPYGEFVADPDGEIMEIKFIDSSDYKKNFDWGEIGDRIMERAMELKKQYDSK